MYYEEDEDSDFETLGIPSDEETRHINEVPLQKGTKKDNSRSSAATMHKPKLPPKPKWNPGMDLSQINNNDEHMRKITQVEKEGITTSMPAVKSSEKPSMTKQLSLQPQKMVAPQKDTTNVHTNDSGTCSVPTCNNQPSLLNNSYQPSSLSNLKFGDDSTPNTPDVVKKDVELPNVELIPFAAEDQSTSPETAKTNSTSHSTKEDGEMFRSLSIDSGEHEVISDGEDNALEENHDEIVELPDGDEETAKGKLE